MIGVIVMPVKWNGACLSADVGRRDASPRVLEWMMMRFRHLTGQPSRFFMSRLEKR